MVEKCVNRHLGILKDRETTINISDLPQRWRMVARRTWTQEGAAGRRGERRGGRPSFRQRTGSPAMSLHGQFAPGTPPGFPLVRRGRSVCGARYPLPKTKKFSDWSSIFGGAANTFFSADGGAWPPCSPPLPLGYAPEHRARAQPVIAQNLVAMASVLVYFFSSTRSPTAMLAVS